MERGERGRRSSEENKRKAWRREGKKVATRNGNNKIWRSRELGVVREGGGSRMVWVQRKRLGTEG